MGLREAGDGFSRTDDEVKGGDRKRGRKRAGGGVRAAMASIDSLSLSLIWKSSAQKVLRIFHTAANVIIYGVLGYLFDTTKRHCSHR